MVFIYLSDIVFHPLKVSLLFYSRFHNTSMLQYLTKSERKCNKLCAKSQFKSLKSWINVTLYLKCKWIEESRYESQLHLNIKKEAFIQFENVSSHWNDIKYIKCKAILTLIIDEKSHAHSIKWRKYLHFVWENFAMETAWLWKNGRRMCKQDIVKTHHKSFNYSGNKDTYSDLMFGKIVLQRWDKRIIAFLTDSHFDNRRHLTLLLILTCINKHADYFV